MAELFVLGEGNRSLFELRYPHPTAAAVDLAQVWLLVEQLLWVLHVVFDDSGHSTEQSHHLLRQTAGTEYK